MRPKGKLFALLTIFVAIGLVTATGAFTSVSATRTAEVNVAGDAAALLQLQPHQSANGFGDGVDAAASPENSYGYAQLSDGNLEINLAGFANDNIGAGVNTNATTDLQGVFNITNAGTQTVYVTVNDADDAESDGSQDGYVVFYNTTDANIDESADGSGSNYGGLETDEGGNAVELEPGERVVVHIKIDIGSTPGASSWVDLVDTITIDATTTQPGTYGTV